MNLKPKHLLLALLLALMAVGCSSPGHIVSNNDEVIQLQRIQTGIDSLDNLLDKDVLIQINNAQLEQHFRTKLLSLSTSEITIQNIEVRFSKQKISIEASFETSGINGTPTRGNALGDIHLVVGGDRVFWFPILNDILLANETANRPAEDVDRIKSILEIINSTVETGLWLQHNNVIRIRSNISGQIEMVASLQHFSVISNPVKRTLGGIVTVKSSAILIDAKQTSILLDLEFVPGLSHCPTEFSVSRSAFARRISAREPKDLVKEIITDGEELNFYTELTSTKRPFTLVHYWFADGHPVDVSELPVETSTRWRTWSTMLIDRSIGTHWEVYAVDKESGCVVDSAAIDSVVFGDETNAVANNANSFAQYREAFQDRVSTFSSGERIPSSIRFEVSRAFIRETLNTTLKKLNLVLKFEIKDVQQQNFSSVLSSFEGTDIQCDLHDCELETDCKADFSQCELHKDTRDCQSCSLHNPLNNRCLRVVLDPGCQEKKNLLNQKYEFNWNACLAREENSQVDCQHNKARRIETCKSQADAEQAACQQNRNLVTGHADVLADVEGQARLSGSLSLIVSNMEIAEDFEQVQMDLETASNLVLDGTVNFAPRSGFEATASCLAAWSSSFQSHEIRAPLPDRRIGSSVLSSHALLADFSTFSTAVMLNPSPMEAIFQTNSQSIDACGLGLKPYQVATAIPDGTGELLNGVWFLDFEQMTTKIVFSNISVSLAGIEHNAEPQLSEQHLRYELN